MEQPPVEKPLKHDTTAEGDIHGGAIQAPNMLFTKPNLDLKASLFPGGRGAAKSATNGARGQRWSNREAPRELELTGCQNHLASASGRWESGCFDSTGRT